MADFGNAGKRTVRASEVAATVDATKGEFIICILDVTGGVAIFTFACPHDKELYTPTGPPMSRYPWCVYDHVNSRIEGDVHVLTLRFTGGATCYRYRMELFDENMVLVKTLKDIDFETSDRADVANESIRLRTK